MKKAVQILMSGVLLGATLWYVNTALVYPVADPLGPWLVVKPFHGIYPFYGGGEQIKGVNPPPGPTPWWMTYEEFHTLKFSHYETELATWEWLYALGYWLTLLGWTVLAVLLFRRLALPYLVEHAEEK
jgi:hypothetical protein